MKKRILSFTLIFALAMTSLFACAPKETKKTTVTKTKQEKLTRVTLNEVAHSIFYAPMYVAIEEGYFKEQGIELDLVTGLGVIYLVQIGMEIHLMK